jgi:uncharacterized membrane protein
VTSSTFLKYSVSIWFAIATLGQWMFGIYIALFYGKNTLTGDFENWNKVLPNGYIKGDLIGNTLVGIHVLIAIVMVIGGPLQFIPAIRNKFKIFHRTLGRAYVTIAILMALSGFIMVWTRSAIGGIIQHLSISIQAIYIICFAVAVIKNARNKDFISHEKWAWRLFLVCNGVWFFRVGLMAWLVIHKAPIGFDPKTFDGPFLWFLAIFTYALPLSLFTYESYLLAVKSKNNIYKWGVSSMIVILTLIMALGIVGATMGMWLPRI